MSENKRTVERYIDGFNRLDHAQILSCLTEDVEWELPGAFSLAGKEAFDKEIENDAFTGRPIIAISSMVEEGDVVVAEGTVKSLKRSGEPFSAAFCDVFVMEGARIRRLTSYVIEVKPLSSPHSPDDNI